MGSTAVMGSGLEVQEIVRKKIKNDRKTKERVLFIGATFYILDQ
jgi:hypothetical protein